MMNTQLSFRGRRVAGFVSGFGLGAGGVILPGQPYAVQIDARMGGPFAAKLQALLPGALIQGPDSNSVVTATGKNTSASQITVPDQLSAGNPMGHGLAPFVWPVLSVDTTPVNLLTTFTFTPGHRYSFTSRSTSLPWAQLSPTQMATYVAGLNKVTIPPAGSTLTAVDAGPPKCVGMGPLASCPDPSTVVTMGDFSGPKNWTTAIPTIPGFDLQLKDMGPSTSPTTTTAATSNTTTYVAIGAGALVLGAIAWTMSRKKRR